MSSFEDDEDAFLYGPEQSDSNVTQSTEGLEFKPNNIIESSLLQEAPVETEYSIKDKSQSPNGSESEYSDEDSDSDIEFVIDSKPGDVIEAPSRNGPYSQRQVGNAEGQAESVFVSAQQGPGLDINKVAEYDGKPLTQLQLETLEEKPWRKPGADITDYFNYGFDEFSWTAYCSKQDSLREEFNPQKLMSQLIGGMAPGMEMPMFAPGMDMGMMNGFSGGPKGFMPPPEMMMNMYGGGAPHVMPGGMPGIPGNMPVPGGDMFDGQNQSPQMGGGPGDNGAYGGNNFQAVAGMGNPNPHASYNRNQRNQPSAYFSNASNLGVGANSNNSAPGNANAGVNAPGMNNFNNNFNRQQGNWRNNNNQNNNNNPNWNR
ncbi:Fip1-domain-containing protein [Nadsonia fulvescens var. elongata DSM 6958]|uniref:Pre-mRNA polyadenylation factor FIP1 n=1 Tax=Nadsonia fulvescens var. elongata DSM 6958 TaxID=857566 RepID=A0A1E3PE85_9ASCO|nr:Fip1-domain-containing protein [Nadsonia fulvescens var. elongata DSM 6958]